MDSRPSHHLQATRTPAVGSSAKRQDALVLGQAGDSKPLLIAVDGEDPLGYVIALVAGGGPTGMRAPHVPNQWLSTPNQPYRNTRTTGSTSFANNSTLKSEMLWPPSFEYARQAAEQSYPPHQPLPCQLASGVGLTSARTVNEVSDQILEDLCDLARWPRLRDPTLPPPVVGEIESDPSGIADRLGVKGKSVLTAFINIDDLSCRVCAFNAKSLPLAILHQQHARHFRA